MSVSEGVDSAQVGRLTRGRSSSISSAQAGLIAEVCAAGNWRETAPAAPRSATHVRTDFNFESFRLLLEGCHRTGWFESYLQSTRP